MRALLNVIAIVLIIFGIISLGYVGFTYTSKEEVAKVGNVELSADTEKTVMFSPVVGGVSLLVGIVLLAINRRRD